MKILELNIHGYRSLRDVTWTPGDLNVLIGPNAGGKSNLLRVLELIGDSADKQLAKHVQAEAGMEAMLWDGKAREISIRMKTSPVFGRRPGKHEDLTYSLRLERIGLSNAYRIGSELLGNYFEVEQGLRQEPFKFLERDGLHAVIFDVEEKELRAPEESVPEEETLLSIAAGPFDLNRVISDFQAQVANWAIYPEFQAGRDAPSRKGVVSRVDTRLERDGANLISVLHTLYTGKKDFKKDINDAMRAAFGPDFEELIFAPAADQRIQLRVAWKSLNRPQSAADLSDGTLRFLYVMAILANPEPPPLIAIDEPEIGLHPSMQRIVAEFAVDASTRSQVVLTTHSPEFLDAFDQTIPTTTVVESHDGQTQLRDLSGDALKEWMKHYTLGEILRTDEAMVIEKEEND